MNIWVIQTGERLPLQSGTRMMRTGLLAQELARRNHSVTWWASAFDHYTRSWVDSDDGTRKLSENLTLRLLRGIGYNRNVSLKRFTDHALVARKFAASAKSAQRPDIIIAALPDYRIAYEAYRYARRNHVPFVLDLRDRWPWDFLSVVPTRFQWIARAVLASDFRMAKTLISKSTALITMMSSWAPWIKSTGGRIAEKPDDAVFYLGAERPKYDPARVGPAVKAAIESCVGRWPILFIGAFNSFAWPQIATDVAPMLEGKVPPGVPTPLFVIAGDGDYMVELRRLCEGRSDMLLPGYVNDAEIAALLDIAKVGLVTGNSDYEAMPNKVFTYLSGGVPILSQLGGELGQFIAQENLGLSCRNPEAMSEAILYLMQNEAVRARMGAQAKSLFDEQYEASRLYGLYADHLERIAAREADSRKGR